MTSNHEHSYVNTLAKYLILTGIVYLVAMNVPSNKLSKNELLLISVFVSLLVALLDLYGDVFNKLFKYICNCKNK